MTDKTLEHILELDGVRYVIDDVLGLWVKFEVKNVKKTIFRRHGIRYSFSLHDRTNQRIMGFDNSHSIEYGGKQNVAPKRQYDHWHYDHTDKGKPYEYKDAASLLHDFWCEVDRVLKTLNEVRT